MNSDRDAWFEEHEALTEKLYDRIGDHNHAHVCSNHPGGHLCDRQCISSFLAMEFMRWRDQEKEPAK